jgi:predicted dienelactone hydrolase
MRHWYLASLLLLAACSSDDKETATADTGAGSGADTTDVSDGSETADTTEASGDTTGSGDTTDASGDTGPTFDLTAPLSWPVDETGPFVVGYRRWETTYTSPGNGEQRTIGINIWYPATEKTATSPNYLNLALFRDPDVYVDAPPAPPVYPNGKYPVWAHSHGSQAYGGSSSDLMRHLASHGWVAVSPDHTNNLFNQDVNPRPLAFYAERPTDVMVAIDQLDALPDATWLAGTADTSRVIISGHSFGSFDAWALAGGTYDTTLIQGKCDSGEFPDCTPERVALFAPGFREPRAIAVVPMAGRMGADWRGADGLLSVNIPMLLMSGSNDDVGNADAFAQMTGKPVTWIDLAGGCHETFALGFCTTLNKATGYGLVNTYALSFGRQQMFADSSVDAILDGSQVVSDLVTLQKRP